MLDFLNGIADLTESGEIFFYALGSYVAMVLIERTAYLLQDGPRWHEKDAISNVINSTFTALADGLISGALFVGAYLLVFDQLRLFEVSYSAWGWVLAFLLNDLAYYVDHRIAHRTGLFWALHTTHHSSREMNLTVSSRGSALEIAGLMKPTFLLLAFVGVPLPMFLAAKFIGNLWGIFNHSRLVKRMGVLEHVLATPSNHRVHHGTEDKYLDRNYGQTLIVWDRLFGSYQREEEEPVYGLVNQMDSYRVWDIQTWGVRWLIGRMRKADRWQDRLKYLWKPPGWSHDGRHTTTEAIRAGRAGPIPAE